MKNWRLTLTAGTLLVWLVSTACGGAAPTPAPAATAAVSEPAAATAPPAAATTRPPASPTAPAAPSAATATLDPTRKTLDLSRTTQPGSTLAGTVVEQIIFGADYDSKKNEILAPAFAFPVAAPKVLYAFGVANGAQALAFTETLKLNDQDIPLPVAKFAVPPSGPAHKQLRVKTLAVKPGAQFPEGRYQVEVYAAGQVVQRGVFEIHRPKGTSRLPGETGRPLPIAWAGERPAKIDPGIFVVTETEVEVVPEEADYYEAEALQAAYEELKHLDELYEPFPDDVLDAIEAEAELEAAALCAEAGGAFEPGSGACLVAAADLEPACLVAGGAYDPHTGACSFGEADSDDDGWSDSFDNCPFTANTDQADADGNGRGDACDQGDDADGDGWSDSFDNCPTIANAGQEDVDGDGLGDACDSAASGGGSGSDDADGDGWSNAFDNCPSVANAGQDDTDGDGVGDACDSAAGGGGSSSDDADGDGWSDTFDNCPSVANAGQEDTDGDGVGDACDSGGGAANDSDGDGWMDDQDNCPSVANAGQEDADSDGVGDACDSGGGAVNDSDGDGWADDQDNCPSVANAGQEDADSDGVGDACDAASARRLSPPAWAAAAPASGRLRLHRQAQRPVRFL